MEVLKFAIPQFIIGVLLVHNGSGQAWWCPGSGPPLVPRSKHPLEQPQKEDAEVWAHVPRGNAAQTSRAQGRRGARHMWVFSGFPQVMQASRELYEQVTLISMTANLPVLKMREVHSLNQLPVLHGKPRNRLRQGCLGCHKDRSLPHHLLPGPSRVQLHQFFHP